MNKLKPYTPYRIIVGHNDPYLARAVFPRILDPRMPKIAIPAEVTFVDTHGDLVGKVLEQVGQYDLVVTSLNYNTSGEEGFRVLEDLKGTKPRKVLWTRDAYNPNVRQTAAQYGADVLDKPELGTPIGLVHSQAPIRELGEVMVCAPAEYNNDLKRMFKKIRPEGMKITHSLPKAIAHDKYGLVIDLTTINGPTHGSVARYLGYTKLDRVPLVHTIHDYDNLVNEILRVANNYLRLVPVNNSNPPTTTSTACNAAISMAK